MKIIIDPAKLSVVLVLLCATISQTAVANFPKLAPRMNMKNAYRVLSHALFVEFIINMG